MTDDVDDVDDVLRKDMVTLTTIAMEYATAKPERKQHHYQLLLMHLGVMERRHGHEETQFILGKVVAAVQREFGPLRKEESE